MNDVSVFLQTCPARRHLLHKTVSWIERSDIGKNYTVLEHPEEQSLADFFWEVLTMMSKAPTKYTLRLEDDAMVGHHILHNVSGWSALEEENFGAGWLFVPDGPLNDRERIGRGKLTGEPYRKCPEMYAALAVLLPTDLIPAIMERTPKRMPQDFAITRGLWAMDKMAYFHLPSLVQNQTWPSARGHDFNPQASTWTVDWRRS